MNKEIPVLVHHELNAKPQTGGGKNQLYVKYCIEQAERYNKRVILFGDDSNRKYADEWYDTSHFFSEKWNRFLNVFENMSYYPLSWAKSFFKRFYIFEQWMQENDIEECIILDSDVLVYRNFSDGLFDDYDLALEIEKDQSMFVIEEKNDLRWVAVAGVAYFTFEALNDFTSFCIEMYENQKNILRKKWNIHLAYHLPGGVCEMSLLYLWYQSQKNVFHLINLYCENKNRIGSLVVNGNGNGYLKNMYNVDKRRLLKINWKDGFPYVIENGSGREIRVDSLHFGGQSKIFMKAFFEQKKYTLSAYLEWYYWKVSGKLKNLVRKIKSYIIYGMGFVS